MSSALPSSCFFQPWISVGWTPCWLASSFTVLSPFRAASATCALNAAVCLCLFFAAILVPFPGLPLSSLVGCPVFGVHYKRHSSAAGPPSCRLADSSESRPAAAAAGSALYLPFGTSFFPAVRLRKERVSRKGRRDKKRG